jgi:hypothetical protein
MARSPLRERTPNAKNWRKWSAWIPLRPVVAARPFRLNKLADAAGLPPPKPQADAALLLLPHRLAVAADHPTLTRNAAEDSLMEWIGPIPRFVFFTGKGGVGKTSLSCALAVALAGEGKRVLLVSTDPASNLSQVLDSPVGSDPAPVPGAEGLTAMNVDPQAAAAEYREEMVAPYRGVLPDEVVAGMEE